jgi:hypothetical protein
MKKFGAVLVLFGLFSIMLNYVGFEYEFLICIGLKSIAYEIVNLLGDGLTSRLLISGMGLIFMILAYLTNEDSEESQ